MECQIDPNMKQFCDVKEVFDAKMFLTLDRPQIDSNIKQVFDVKQVFDGKMFLT